MRRLVVEQKKDISSLANEKRGRGVVGGTVPLLCFNGVSFSTNRSHLNTDETIYYNGNFNNVDEVHNNTKNMRLIGFNQTGKNPVTGAGFNQDKHDKEGITRNTVIGNVEIGTSKGSPINTDLSKANETTRDTHRNTNIYVEDNTIKAVSNPKQFVEDFNIAILEGKATVEGAIKKIDNILNGSDDSDISQAEKRRYEEIKEDILRVKTAPEMELIAKGDLSNKEIQDKLGIGGKFNPDDPNLPEKIKERIEEARKQGKEIPYFYDKVTGKIYINENADESTVRAGIGREWGIRDRFDKGKVKPNNEGQLKATVAGEIAYGEIENRLKGKNDKIDPNSFEYAQFDPDSEITSDITAEQLRKGKKELKEIGNKIVKGDLKGAAGQFLGLSGKAGKVLINNANDITKGGKAQEKVINETKEAIDKEVVAPIKKKQDEKKRIRDEFIKELSSKDCNGKCKKEQQKTADDLRKDYTDRLACRAGDRKDCKPNSDNTSELIIFKTDEELIKYSEKAKAMGIRGNYRFDSQERIDRAYNNASQKAKEEKDYDRVMKLSKNEGKSPEQLYKEGKISEKQWKNYNAEVNYRAVIGATANVINNSAAPIVNSLYAGMNENSRKAYSEWEANNRAGETGSDRTESNQNKLNDNQQNSKPQNNNSEYKKSLNDLGKESIEKNFNAKSENGSEKGYKVNGDYKKALEDFNNLNPKNVKKISKENGKELYMGEIEVGDKKVIVTVRNFSSKKSDNTPTLELLEEGKANSKKIRYIKD